MASSVPAVMRSSFDQAIDRLFEDALGGSSMQRTWTPPCNVYQDETGLTIQVALPGVSAGDVDVQIEKRTLRIKGEQKRHAAGQETSSLVAELPFGPFERSFALPQSVNHDGIKATFKDGLLTLHCPLAEAAKPRRITIE